LRVVFIDLGEVGDPLLGAIAKVLVDSIKIQIAGSALRKFDVAHGLERNAKKEVKRLPLGLKE
jgi:hypothetical protein